MHNLSFLLLMVGIQCLAACSGTQLEGKATVVSKLLRTARENGAYRCAPKELAIATTHYEFSRDEMSQGKYFDAQRLLDIADRNARLAIEMSPPEKCAKRLVVDVKKPVKLAVKVLDRDGDGIYDSVDACPDDPEDKDGFEDTDGCPEPDNDKDGVCDAWVTEKNLQEKYNAICRLKDQCPGIDKDKENAFKDVAEDRDNFEDEDGCPDFDNDKDGLFDKVDKCPDDPEDVDGFEDDDGCPEPDNDKDKICDPWVTEKGQLEKHADLCKGVDKCPNEPETYNGNEDEDGCPDELKLIRVTVQKIELLEKIFFDYNKATIRTQSHALLNEVAKVLKSRPSMTVRIEGHTDDRGGSSYNMKLSRERARSVRKFLIKAGIDPSRMVAEGYGLTKPLVPNTSDANRDQNRRVEFVITNQ
ncbi:OmpA family protein [Myxococcota bacterium]|nr:OmpA family protein [Myxococcota bacterium]